MTKATIILTSFRGAVSEQGRAPSNRGLILTGRFTAIPYVGARDREGSLQHYFDFCFAPFRVPSYLYPGSPEHHLNLERALY